MSRKTAFDAFADEQKDHSRALPPELDALRRERHRRFSIDDAVRYVHLIEREIESIEDYRLKLKWWMGFVLVHTRRPRGRRREVVKEIAKRLHDQYGIRSSTTTLYAASKLYDVCSGDYQWFLDWIEYRKKLFGRPVYWYDVRNELLGGPNNPAVVGQEEADERDLRDAERAFELLERIAERAAGGDEEAASFVEGVRQTVAGLMRIPEGPARVPRDKKYLAFISRHGCVVCGRQAEPHHALGTKGAGVKPSDFGCVPLCRMHHDEIHRMPRSEFEHFHDLSPAEVALNLLHRYVTGVWLTMRLTRLDRGVG